MGLEKAVVAAVKESEIVKPWLEVRSNPGAYRIAGTYDVSGTTIKLKLFLQRFDSASTRKTLSTIELSGDVQQLTELAAKIRSTVDNFIQKAGAK